MVPVKPESATSCDIIQSPSETYSSLDLKRSQLHSSPALRMAVVPGTSVKKLDRIWYWGKKDVYYERIKRKANIHAQRNSKYVKNYTINCVNHTSVLE